MISTRAQPVRPLYLAAPRFAERLVVAAAFFFGTGAIISMFRLPDPEGDPWAGSAEDPITRTLWLGFYVAMLYLLAPHRRELFRLMGRNIWIPVMMALVLLSTLWSPDPLLTLRRAIAIDLGALYGYYLAIRFSAKQVVELLAVALAAALLLSAVFIAFLPSYGVYEDIFRGDTWRGVFLHKNPLGRAAALGLVVFVVLRQHHRRRFLTLAFTTLAVILVLGSGSSTALVATIVPAALALVVPGMRRLGSYGSIGTILVVAAATAGVVAFNAGISGAGLKNSGFNILGKDSTLTDRTTVWEEVQPAIKERPVLGYGVSGFWRGWDGVGSSTVWRHIRWRPVHAHNGYFDLTLELGLVGLLVFLLGLLVAVTHLLRAADGRWPIAQLWPCLFFPFLLIESAAESVLVRPNSIYWILFVFTVASLAKRATPRSGLAPE